MSGISQVRETMRHGVSSTAFAQGIPPSWSSSPRHHHSPNRDEVCEEGVPGVRALLLGGPMVLHHHSPFFLELLTLPASPGLCGKGGGMAGITEAA